MRFPALLSTTGRQRRARLKQMHTTGSAAASLASSSVSLFHLADTDWEEVGDAVVDARNGPEGPPSPQAGLRCAKAVGTGVVDTAVAVAVAAGGSVLPESSRNGG